MSQTENWLVSEYVYNPDGSFAGILRQKRRLETLADKRIRVVQEITPGVELGQHPMAELAGESTYDMLREGQRRRFQGPDLLGTALFWGSDVVTARGVWTRFGHNFSMQAVSVTPERQVYAARYFNASEPIATVIGLAVTDSAGEYPQFSASFYPQEASRVWEGTVEGFGANGGLLVTGEEARRYHFSERKGWSIHESSRMWQMEEMENRYGIQEAPGDYGVGKRSGWLFEVEHFVPPVAYSRLEILDNAGANLVVLTRTLEDKTLTYFSVMRLKPKL